VVCPVGEVHVMQHPRSGRWVVDTPDGATTPPPGYGTANEAQRAAQRQAAARGHSRVFLHDCYHRIRPVPARGRRFAAKG
jgi:Uncharacterized protein conserved in bacteria (DUF2188)